MKLTSIDLYSNNQQVASLSFRDPKSTNPYIAQSTTGLDADEIVSKYYGRSGKTGVGSFNLSLLKREVVILVSLNPQFSLGKTYSDLRDDLYRAISSSRDGTVQLRFNNGKKTIAVVSGFVSKFETNLFSKTPQVQLSINCDEGMLLSPNLFEEDVIHIDTDTTLVDKVSTAPHGFAFQLEFDDPTSSFAMQDEVSPNPAWFFEVVYDFLAGDELHFSSITTQKELYVVRGSTTTHLIDKISLGSTWPIMFPNNNDIQFVSDGDFTWNWFNYYHSFWGV